jgi:hypothetical protein
MLQFPNTRVIASTERPVAAGAVIDQEGKALVADWTGGVFGVKKSTGAAGEQFVGASVNMLMPVTELPFGETLTQDATNTITLANTPIAGTILLVDTNSGTVQTAGSPSTANQYSISGKVITLNSAQTGHKYSVAYRFAPTVAQAIATYGNVHPGGPAGQYLGQIGVITQGDVYTTEYDTTVDWSVGGVVKLGANGLFTLAGSGVSLSNVTIIKAPAAGNAVLGLEIR